jgi:hypothetical protein
MTVTDQQVSPAWQAIGADAFVLVLKCRVASARLRLYAEEVDQIGTILACGRISAPGALFALTDAGLADLVLGDAA